MLVKGIVILGVACPEITKTNDKNVCVAGWHKDIGLLRLHPCKPTNKLGRWKVYDLDIEKVGPKDSRLESYQLVKPVTTEIKPVRTIRKPEDKRRILDGLVVDCVEDINDSHHSLCIVRPKILKTYWRDNEKKETNDELEEEFAWCLSRDRYKYSPKIDFLCSDNCRNKSGRHKKTVIEWGAYQVIRKFNDKDQYWENLALEDRDAWFLLGNMKNQRNCFIIIAVITLKKLEN